MQGRLEWVDIGILFAYSGVLIWMGVYYARKCRTADQFMVADRTIPAWAAGLAVMSAYTSSISTARHKKDFADKIINESIFLPRN